MDKRDLAIQLRLEGKPYSHIGVVLGVSRQRAQQLVAPPRNVQDFVMVRAGGRCEKCESLIAMRSAAIHHLGSDNPASFNAPENLQFLCPSCHRHVHDPVRPAEGWGKATVMMSWRLNPDLAIDIKEAAAAAGQSAQAWMTEAVQDKLRQPERGA